MGGAETSLRLIAEYLAARGHSVFFVGKSFKRAFTASRIEIINGVNVVFLSKYFNPLKVYYLNRLGNLKHGKTIRSILLEEKIDIVYTYYNLSLCKRYLKLKKLPGFNFKFVVRIAGMRWQEQIKVNASLKKVYHNLFEEADSLNFISEGLFQLYKEGLKDLGMASIPKHHFIKDIGVAEIIKKTMVPHETTTEGFKCVMVSRFSRYQKRQDLLIEALSLLDEKVPIHLTLIGEGPYKSKIQKQAQTLGVAEKITFLSFLPQTELWNTIAQHNVLCHACDYEGLSKIIIESMAIGMPVLASDVLPLNSYISEGANGYLVANSAAAWAKKIEKFYEQRETLKEVGNTGANFIKENYNASINVLEYERQFENLIQANNRNSNK